MTNYIKKENIDDDIIFEVGHALRNGKLVVFPTDTIYGIGTNAYLKNACERIYEVKGRPKYKPLIVLISAISMLEQLVDSISPVEQKLMDMFWPGALTIKFKKKEDALPDIVSAGDEYVRVRLINDGLLFSLLKAAGVPIVAPSANLSGSLPGTRISNIIAELDGKVDYILDCGDIESEVVSTIVQVEDEKILIIREGKIKKEELEKVAPLKI